MVNYIKLNKTNIDKELENYLNSIRSLRLPKPQKDILKFIDSLKRKRIDSGRYPDVSLFEASNLIYSDLIILLGVRQLLTNPVVGNVRLPFKEYKVRLGVESGLDLEANYGRHRLVGEAFNASESLFHKKKRDAVEKLNDDDYKEADYRMIIFNKEAVRNSDIYIRESKQSMLYLPVSMPKTLREIDSLIYQ